MQKVAAIGLILASIALLGSGCAADRGCRYSSCDNAGPTAPMPPETRTDRGNLQTDTSSLVSYDEVSKSLGPVASPAQYRVLRADEIQCMAAANSPLAKLYAAESRSAMCADSGRRGSQEAATVQSRLMAFRAVEERNKSAGIALELYYSLAEAEAGRDVLDRTLEEIDRAAANFNEIKQSGLTFPVDRSAIERQRLDWLDKRIEMQAAADKIQGQLQQLCGLDADGTTPIWPQADLVVTVAQNDAQSAITEGLANRADVVALQMLACSLSVDTLPAARSGMQGVSPGLGTSLITKRLLGGAAGDQQELQLRRTQLSQAQYDAEQNAKREINESLQNVDARLRAAAVAKERLDLRQKRVADLQEKRNSNGTSAFDLSMARLEALAAEADMQHRVIAWKIAEVKLKQAQGLLAAECGYDLPCHMR